MDDKNKEKLEEPCTLSSVDSVSEDQYNKGGTIGMLGAYGEGRTTFFNKVISEIANCEGIKPNSMLLMPSTLHIGRTRPSVIEAAERFVTLENTPQELVKRAYMGTMGPDMVSDEWDESLESFRKDYYVAAERRKALNEALDEIDNGTDDSTKTTIIDSVPSEPNIIYLGSDMILVRYTLDEFNSKLDNVSYNGYPSYGLPKASPDGKFYFIERLDGEKGTFAPVNVIVEGFQTHDDPDGDHIVDYLREAEKVFKCPDLRLPSKEELYGMYNDAPKDYSDKQKFRYNRKSGKMEMAGQMRPKKNKSTSSKKKGGKRRR